MERVRRTTQPLTHSSGASPRRPPHGPRPGADPELVKISDLARRSEVPVPTIKHYLREGLLPGPARKTSRNMAWYDASLVGRIRRIKSLQREHFLPLKVIREVLDGDRTLPPDDDTALQVLSKVLREDGGTSRVGLSALVEAGHPAEELVWLEEAGILSPHRDGVEPTYSGDDLALLNVLLDARRAGLGEDMLPYSVLGPYAASIRQLVRMELSLFRGQVLPLAGQRLESVAEAATRLSERLVMLLRRRALVPMMERLVREEAQRQAQDP